MSSFSYDPRFKEPSPEVMRRMELSRLEAEKIQTREMRCPICGFLVRIIPVSQTDIVFVKCRKCKFEGALSPAYFRRIHSRKMSPACICSTSRKAGELYGKDLYLH